MNLFANATIIAATILFTSSARADDVSGKALADVRASPGYATAVAAAARESPTWTLNPCLDAKARLGGTTIVDAPRRDAEGSVMTGRCIEHVLMDGCMTERDLNVAVEATATGLAFRPTLPGSTRAPLRLQETLTTKAFAAAGMDPSGCSPTMCWVPTTIAIPGPTTTTRRRRRPDGASDGSSSSAVFARP